MGILYPAKLGLIKGGRFRATGLTNTLSLSHFNGTDAATTFSDEALGEWTVSTAVLELDTAQKQFGSASLRVPSGDADATGFAGAFTSPHTGDWTLEFFFRVSDTTQNSFIVSLRTALNNDATSIQFSGSTMTVEAGNANYSYSAAQTVNNNTWRHAAVVRSGGDYISYYEGNRVNVQTVADNGAAVVRVGVSGAGNGASDVWIDEIRASKTARYTGATYTIPTAELVVD